MLANRIMITLSQAIKNLEKLILGRKPEMGIIEDSSEEYESCYVIYIQSKKFIESRDFNDMCIGHGPVIVCKETGKIFETGSAYPTEQYVQAFTNCGDPYGTPTLSIRIDGWLEGARSIKAIKCIRKYTGMGLAIAKSKIDDVLSGTPIVVELGDIENAETFVSELSAYGFTSIQIWHGNS